MCFQISAFMDLTVTNPMLSLFLEVDGILTVKNEGICIQFKFCKP